MECDPGDLQHLEDDSLIHLRFNPELTPVARECIEAELSRRGLDVLRSSVDPGAARPEFQDTLTVARFRDITEAIVARGALASAGIPSILRDENLVRMEWQLSNFIGGVRLQVAPDAVEEAAAVLAAYESGTPDYQEDSLSPEDVSDTCSRCGSSQIRLERSGRRLAIAALFAFGLPVPVGEVRSRCDHCGFVWCDSDPV